jgi:hypothetical protein
MKTIGLVTAIAALLALGGDAYGGSFAKFMTSIPGGSSSAPVCSIGIGISVCIGVLG